LRVCPSSAAARAFSSATLCGDTAALLDDATLVVGRRRNRDPYGRGTDAGLVFVDLQAGKIERSLPLPEDPADLLAAG
jgi:hypothetical protein